MQAVPAHEAVTTAVVADACHAQMLMQLRSLVAVADAATVHVPGGQDVT